MTVTESIGFSNSGLMFEAGVETVTVFLMNRPRASLSGISFILAQQGRGFFHRALAILPALIRRLAERATVERSTPSSMAIWAFFNPAFLNCSTFVSRSIIV